MTDKPESPTPEITPPEDEMRFAPPVMDDVPAPEEVRDFVDESPEAYALEAEVVAFEIETVNEELNSAPEVDLDAALAAISALDDMLAEQEASELAELARQQAEEDARAKRQARLQSPELFFPMPSLSMMQRGRLDSVVPALALIGIGAWLTFALTTGTSAPSLGLLALVIGAGLGLTLLVHWLNSGRWALGTLFFGLCSLLVGGIFAFVFAQGTLPTDWPLLLMGPGLAFLITGVIAREGKLLPPGLLLVISSLAALAVTNRLLPEGVLSTLAGLWPLALVIVAVVLLLPRFARR
jgi:hypothetical protein